jgi:tetratricopeptide (TPR) repeat protein
MNPLIRRPNKYLQLKSWMAATILGVALLLAYSNSFRVPLIFDDTGSITENETIRSFSTAFLPGGNSGNTVSGRPVLNFSLAINYAIGGTDVVSYHILNLLIHFAGSLTLFGLIKRTLLLPRMLPDDENRATWLSLAAASLWALHPLQTESVTYIIQRAESLVGLFYLLTFYCFVRGIGKKAGTHDSPESNPLKGWLGLSVIACLIGMGSKEVMAGAPVLVFLFDRTFVSGSFREAWRLRKHYYIALALTWILLALCVLWTGKRGSTVGYNEFATWWRYSMTQGVAILHYLKRVFWPHPLVLDYGTTMAADFDDAGRQTILVALLFLVSAWAVWKRPRVGFLAAFFFAVLAPSSSIVPVLTQTMAEHRMYLALAAPLGLVVIIAYRWLGFLTVPACLVVSVALAATTFRRNHDYRTEESIWVTVTEDCPYNARGWGALTAIYTKQDDLQKAKWAARQGILYCPKNADCFVEYANVLIRLKEKKEAEQVLRYALEVQPLHLRTISTLGVFFLEEKRPRDARMILEEGVKLYPDSNELRYSLGKAFVALRFLPQAIDQFTRVITEDPKAIDARNNLANALIDSGQSQQAIAILNEGLKIDPTALELSRTLGLALVAAGQTSDAIQTLEKTVRQNPQDSRTHANLALAFSNADKHSEALDHFEQAIRLDREKLSEFRTRIHISAAESAIKAGKIRPGIAHSRAAVELEPADPQIRYFLANLLMQIGENASAADHYEKIINQAPDFVDARRELGIVYARLGRPRDARAQFQAVLKLIPDDTEAGRALESLR